MFSKSIKGILVVIIALFVVYLMITLYVNYIKDKETIEEEEPIEEKEMIEEKEFKYLEETEKTLEFVFLDLQPKITGSKSVGSFLYFSWEKIESEKIVAVRIYRNDKPDSIYASFIAEMKYPCYDFYDSTNAGNDAYYWICFIDKLGFESKWSDRIFVEKNSVDFPKNLRGYAEGNNIVLLWDTRMGEEIIYYKIFKCSSNSKNKSTVINKVYFPSTEYVDRIEGSYDTLYYWVSAVDTAGNESEKSNFLKITSKKDNNLVTTEQLIDKFTLEQNYPNPCNSSTTIPFTLNSAGNVILKVYDITGKEVETLLSEYKDVGRYEINYNFSNLASGVYIYVLNVNDFTDKKKLVVLK
ncbi:MAG: T9SS type A sorting domain-containing protein [Ignavibacteriales bacterium]|nr:T9SS type A sorting domain-containing protein [Ignavibacteriales bacterium]